MHGAHPGSPSPQPAADERRPEPARHCLSLPSGRLSLERVQIVGVLPVRGDTPPDAAAAEASRMAADGAGMVDLVPHPPVSPLHRLTELIETVRRASPIPLCVTVDGVDEAGAALKGGAALIRSDRFANPQLRRLVAGSSAAAVVVSCGGCAVVGTSSLSRVAAACQESGLDPGRLVIDPGPDLDLAALRQLDALAGLPFPVALDVSSQPVIAQVAGGVEAALDGSLALAAWAVLKGIRVLRATEVRPIARACRMTEAVLDPSLVLDGSA